MKQLRLKKQLNSILVFALFFIFGMSLMLGITGAFYRGRQQARGNVSFNDGLYYSVSNTGTSSNTLMFYDNKDFSLPPIELSTIGGQNSVYYLTNPTIQVEDNTADFYIRAKLNYKFFTLDTDGVTHIETDFEALGTTENELINSLFALKENGTPISFGPQWILNAETGYFYYLKAGSSVVNLQSLQVITNTTDDFGVFKTEPQTDKNSNTAMVSNLRLGSWDSRTGGPFGISKFEIELVVETVEVKAESTLWNLPS